MTLLPPPDPPTSVRSLLVLSWSGEHASTPGSSGHLDNCCPAQPQKRRLLLGLTQRRIAWLIPLRAWRTANTEDIKRKFNRLGRHGSTFSINNTMPAPANGSADSESTPLLGRRETRDWRDTPKHVAAVTWATLASNYVNVFLVFVPLGIIAGALGWNPTAVFVLNFVAIIPLASLLSFATEELSAKLGQTMGGLMNATFGNAVELIVRLCTASTSGRVNKLVINHYRSPLLRSKMVRSASCNPACWDPSCPTFCL